MNTTFLTHSGRLLDFSDIDSDKILLDDIAHHLSSYSLNRFGGSLDLDIFYPVAQHSINMARWCLDQGLSVEIAKAALMHDAAEAYLGDMVTGLKNMMPEYRKLESQFHAIICGKFGVINNEATNRYISQIDARILMNEAEAMMSIQNFFTIRAICNYVKELSGVNLKPNRKPYRVYREFLKMCDILNVSDK